MGSSSCRQGLVGLRHVEAKEREGARFSAVC